MKVLTGLTLRFSNSLAIIVMVSETYGLTLTKDYTTAVEEMAATSSMHATFWSG